jgi:hypothetical protein
MDKAGENIELIDRIKLIEETGEEIEYLLRVVSYIKIYSNLLYLKRLS